MKHLNPPLIGAYPIVRSRCFSVLIQPHMQLLYNLLRWEVKLAKEHTIAVRAVEMFELAVPGERGLYVKREVSSLTPILVFAAFILCFYFFRDCYCYLLFRSTHCILSLVLFLYFCFVVCHLFE